jgi:cytochrome P450
VGAIDITRNRKLLDKTLGFYETFSQAATMAPIVFPWFPSVNLIKRYLAGARLFFILNGIVKKRKQPGAAKERDALQDMVDRNDKTSEIVGVMMGALFAAQQNSGINVSWVLLYLASNPEWCAKARAEVLAAAAKHSPTEGKAISFEEKVANLPLEAWESEFPTLDLCLKDSIRLHALGACFRRNISMREVSLGKSGDCVPEGVFAVSQ